LGIGTIGKDDRATQKKGVHSNQKKKKRRRGGTRRDERKGRAGKADRED